MMAAAAAAATVASAATVAPGLIPPPPGQKVLSVRHYEAGPPLPEEGQGPLAKTKDGAQEIISPDHCETSSAPKEECETTPLCLLPSTVPGSEGGPELLEEEWVTRKRVELTTTRQTETRVKRQVELDEEGRVVGDSGPIVTTSTTEDTHSEEQKHTEHRAIGPDDEPLPPLEGEGAITSATKELVASAEDGSVLVREVRERKVNSREEIEEVRETEDIVHLGDITDEGYIAAVLENKDIRTAAVDSKALTSTGPRLVRQSARGHRVVDIEDTEEASVATPDGRLLTETKTQHQHEVEDMEEDDDEEGKDLPDETIEGEGKKHKFVRTKEEEFVSYLADGVKVAEEMKYRAENFEGEKEAGDETDAPRLRALKSRGSRGAPPASPGNGERKDALTRRPLDLDAEEETRKVETSKWLEHHFGSDSRSSREGSAGGFDDQESPFYGGVTQGGGSYIGITMTSRTNAAKQDVPLTREPLSTSPLLHNNVNNSVTRIKTPEPYAQPITNGFHHETETTEMRRESVKTTGSSIIGRKDVIQVLPTGPGRTFRPPRGVAVPPPPTTDLVHVEPQKRKKRPPPQPIWTSDVTEDEERLGWSKENGVVKGSRPWSPENDSRTGESLGEDVIGRPTNHITQQYRQSTLSSPSDHSWNRVEEATVSWTNGVPENHVITNGDHHHNNHVGPPSPAPLPLEGVRVARTRRRAPPIPTHVETNGVRSMETPTPPVPPEKKQSHQKTRFADEEVEEDDEEMAGHSEGPTKEESKDKKKKRVKKKKSGSFGDSIRRLMGRLRSRSSEKKRGKEEQKMQQQKSAENSARRGSWKSSSRTPSPDEYCEPTYRRYQSAIDGNIRVPKQERTHHNHQRNHRPVGVPRGPDSSPNEATSGEEYEEEEHNVGSEGRGYGGGGPVAPPRARPTIVSQGHSVTQHRSESQHQHRHHHHGGGSRQQQVPSSRRPPSPVGRHNESSRNEDRSWRGSSSRRRDYAAEASSGGWSSSRRRHAYSPERGSAGAPFSSTTSEGESSRRRESDRVPPVLATSTPMDYEKRHGGMRGRDESGNHVQRFYLGEDPFGGSIYGREREYEGVKRSSRQRHEEHKKSGLRYGATLGRPSASAGNHSSSSHSHSDHTRAQTLPRKLRHSPPHNNGNHVSSALTTNQHSASVRRQLYSENSGIGGSTNHLSKRNGDLQRHTGSLINVSIVNNVTPGTTSRAPPAKPARTYRSNLSRSKSFNVHANQDELDPLPRPKPVNGDKWESPANRYRSNPQLSRILHEESPLKSPGIISSINRSTKDLRDAVKKEEVTSKYTEVTKREENGKDGWLKKEWTPMKFRERTGSGGPDNGRSESVRITTVSDGPSVTRTVRNFEKRSSGDKANGNGRLETTYEATTTVTESVSRPPSIWNRNRKSLGPGFADVPGGGVVIEVRNGRL